MAENNTTTTRQARPVNKAAWRPEWLIGMPAEYLDKWAITNDPDRRALFQAWLTENGLGDLPDA